MHMIFKSAIFLAIGLLILSCSDGKGIATGDGGYDAFFQENTVHDLTVTISLAEWRAMTNDMWKSSREWEWGRGTDYGETKNLYFNSEIYRLADFTNATGGESFRNIGLRVRGSSSRFVPQYTDGSFKWTHWKISFSQDFAEDESVYGSPAVPTVSKSVKRLYGCRGLILKYTRGDATWSREPQAYRMLRLAGIPAPRFTFANLHLRITGYTNLNMGLFQVYEPIDKEYVKRRWGSSSYLFKCLITVDGPATLGLTAITNWDNPYDTDASIGLEKMDPADATEAATWDVDEWPFNPARNGVYRPRYDLKAKKSDLAGARAALNSFIQNLNTLTGSGFADWIKTAFDVDLFLKNNAVDALLGQWDNYWSNHNNFYLLLRPTDGKWVYLPYDYDAVMYPATVTRQDGVSISTTNRSLTNWGSPQAVLMNKLLAVQDFRDKYYDYLHEMVNPTNNLYTWPAIEARMQAINTLVAPYPHAGDIAHDNPCGFSSDFTVIRDFVRARLHIATNELGL